MRIQQQSISKPETQKTASVANSLEKNIQASLPVRIAVLVSGISLLVVMYIFVSGPQHLSHTLDNYRLMITDGEFMRIPLIVMSIILCQLACFQCLYKKNWNMSNCYWFICLSICLDFWILTFSTGTFQSNKVSLVILLAVLFCGMKLYQSLYDTSYNKNFHYIERNLISGFVGYILIMLLVNIGVVMVYSQMIKQRNFPKIFFIGVPFILSLGFFILNYKDEQRYQSSILFWFSIFYGTLIAAYNYGYNEPYNYQQPFYS